MAARVTLFLVIGLLSTVAQAQNIPEDSSRVSLPADTLFAPPLIDHCTSDKVPCGDRWLGPDKALHLGASFLGTVSTQYVLTSKGGMSEDAALPISVSLVLSAGLVKELVDANRPHDPLFSWKDLTADAVGILLAIGLIAL